MNTTEKNMLSLIDKQIAELEKTKEELLGRLPLSEIVKGKPSLWVIHKNSNMYYQYFDTFPFSGVILERYFCTTIETISDFNENYRLASSAESKQHMEFCDRHGRKYLKLDSPKKVGEFKESESFKKMMVNALTKPCDLSEPKQHTIDPKKCDFYMVTVTGEFGTRVRHDNYDNAIKEATRLAKKQNHKAWVTGVVAVIEPIQQEVQVKVIAK